MQLICVPLADVVAPYHYIYHIGKYLEGAQMFCMKMEVCISNRPILCEKKDTLHLSQKEKIVYVVLNFLLIFVDPSALCPKESS
jgi:hypothetical protein